nr:MAG TPA: hypothetical protein [Bacteriophage sp.]
MEILFILSNKYLAYSHCRLSSHSISLPVISTLWRVLLTHL